MSYHLDDDDDDDLDLSERLQEAVSDEIKTLGDAASIIQVAYLKATIEVLQGLAKLAERRLTQIQSAQPEGASSVEKVTVTSPSSQGPAAAPPPTAPSPPI